MQTMRVLKLAVLVVLIVGFNAYAVSVDMVEIGRVATEGLSYFVKKIPSGYEANYGFASEQELERAVLGTPYQTYVVFIEENGLEKIKPLDEWRFPVLVDANPKALLTVTKVDGSWKAVDFGAAALARDIQSVELSKRAQGTIKQKVIVRNHALKVDFLVFPDTEGIEQSAFFPLNSAKKMIELSITQPKPFEQLSTPASGISTTKSMNYGEVISIIKKGLKK